jgi:hypothetical protein
MLLPFSVLSNFSFWRQTEALGDTGNSHLQAFFSVLRIRIRSFSNQAKIVRKTFIPTVL